MAQIEVDTLTDKCWEKCGEFEVEFGKETVFGDCIVFRQTFRCRHVEWCRHIYKTIRESEKEE